MLRFSNFFAHVQGTIKACEGPGAGQHSDVPSNESVFPSRLDSLLSEDVFGRVSLLLSKNGQDNHEDDEEAHVENPGQELDPGHELVGENIDEHSCHNHRVYYQHNMPFLADIGRVIERNHVLEDNRRQVGNTCE